MTRTQQASLAAIKAALDAGPFVDPVMFRGRSMPRAMARDLERRLIAASRIASAA